MESNKILIGIEFGYNEKDTIGGFELMVLRDLSLNQLLDGIRIGLEKKLKSKDEIERENYDEPYKIFMQYFDSYDSVIITSSNKGIDSGISISENGNEKICDLGFITSTRIIFNKNGQAKVYSLNNPDAIVEAFKNDFPQYNISSRQLTVLDPEPIKILPCPDPPSKPKLNILAMILPSMAMTVAMVLGRVLFMGGGVSDIGMIGLSISMVAVNILVSLFNFYRQIKEHNEKVAEWKEQYENYIKKTISKIEKRQEDDANELRKKYPDINILFDDTMKVSEQIFSRAQNDNDFMTVRIGSSDDVDTLFKIEGDKSDVIFAPTKYKWNPQNSGIELVLFPEKTKSKKENEQKELYDTTEDYLVDLPYDISHKYRKMNCGNVPLLLSLRDCGTLGVVSSKAHLINRFMNNIIFELCFYHSPQDLQFVMLYENTIEESNTLSPDNTNFNKFKFSSHFKELFNNRSQFVFDENNAKQMFDSLLSLIYERSAVVEEEAKLGDFTQIVVVVYEEYGIKEHAIANFLPKAPKEGEAYQNNLGITFIFCKKFKEHLPSFCGNIIKIKNKDELHLTPRYDQKQEKSFINLVVKLSEDEIISDAANPDINLLRNGDFYNRLKVLSAIYYTRIAQNAKVPSYVTLFDLLEIQKETDNAAFESEKEQMKAESKKFYEWINEQWTHSDRNDITKSLTVPVGMSENKPVFLDLHEKEDGPHMLVAGTTGSGKSETIISYLIGLCLYYTPEEINLLLIDMKGGGFIKRLGCLPHVVGTVTDVDGDENGTGAEYMLKRFLESLASEVKRRKIFFNQMGVDSIDGYIKKHRKLTKLKNGTPEEKTEFNAELRELKLHKLPDSLSHLIFVVDEFTELKRASSEDSDMDFIAEITTIARVGRSLGFHIILISQNIEGAITDDIRVNSKARLCLKVATRQASKEMLGNDKAAAPDMPGNGRAYLLVGTGSRFEYFQSAYSGAESSQSLEMPFELKLAERTGLYTTFFDSSKDGKKQSDNVETQLAFLVSQITDYCSFNRDEHINPEICLDHRKSLVKPHIIFNQPLPKQIVFETEKNKVQAYSEQVKEWEELPVNNN